MSAIDTRIHFKFFTALPLDPDGSRLATSHAFVYLVFHLMATFVHPGDVTGLVYLGAPAITAFHDTSLLSNMLTQQNAIVKWALRARNEEAILCGNRPEPARN